MVVAEPIVVVMSPPCTGLSGFSGLNRVINPDGWHASRLISLPLGDLAGYIAQCQLHHVRHFVCENPRGSELYTLPARIPVSSGPRLVIAFPAMCMADLYDEQTKLPLRKRSEVWASDERLVKPIRRFVCDGSHEHGVIEGSYAGPNKSHWSRIRTWKFAYSIALGIAGVVRENHYSLCRAFNSCVNSDLDIIEGTSVARYGAYVKGDLKIAKDAVRVTYKCRACNNNLYKEHSKHTRVPGDCRHPHVESIVWTCPACSRGAPRSDPAHSLVPGECRWHANDYRMARNRSSKGQPKDPRVPAVNESGAALAPIPDEFGTSPEDLRLRWARGEGDSDAEQEMLNRALNAPDTQKDRPQIKSERAPRVVPVKREIETQAATPGEDWSVWDLGRSMQLLRSQNEAVVRRTLRMLHLRWWYASAKRMHDILNSTGVSLSLSLSSKK